MDLAPVSYATVTGRYSALSTELRPRKSNYLPTPNLVECNWLRCKNELEAQSNKTQKPMLSGKASSYVVNTDCLCQRRIAGISYHEPDDSGTYRLQVVSGKGRGGCEGGQLSSLDFCKITT